MKRASPKAPQEQAAERSPAVHTVAAILLVFIALDARERRDPHHVHLHGLLSSLPTAYIEYFPRQLGASDAQLSAISIVRSLPWTFKVLFGVFPDRFPIQQLHFKPYLLRGCLISSCFHLRLSAANDSLSIVSFTLLLLGSMVGIVMADVMSDALVANRVLRKQELYPGHVRSVVYLCRFVSEMCGYWGGALISNRSHWGLGSP
ncbi:Folate-biopterin transporter, partial [Globisporangium splendens]